MVFKKDFKIDLFRAKVRVIFTDKVLIEALKYGNDPEDISNFEAIVFDFNGNPVAIFDINTSYDTITHEVFHLVYSILQTRGMELKEETNETYAYLSGYLNKLIIKFTMSHQEIKFK